MDRPLALIVLLLAGCGPPRSKATVVRLPAGLAKPGTATPDATPVSLGLTGSFMAAADSTVAERQGIVVEGACRSGRVSEVECWDLGGDDVPTLARDIAKLVERPEPKWSRRGSLLVVTLPYDPDRVNIDLGSLSTGRATPIYEDGEGVTRRHVYAVDTKAKTIAATFIRTTRRKATARLALQVGAKTVLVGETLTVRSIEPFAKEPFAGWRIVVHASGKTRFVPADRPPILTSGRVRYALRNGRLVTTDAFRLVRLDENLPGGSFALAIDRNPQQARAIVLGVEDVRSITLTGISLHPR